jgi:TonB family protein
MEEMMTKLAVLSLCLLAAACATGAFAVDRETAPHVAPRIEMTAAADTARVLPVARAPELPSADRMYRQILTELGGVASADVRLCVAPDGSVQDVRIVRGSSLAAFDQALVHDVSDWQFWGMRGSSTAHLRNCEIATIRYRLRS